MKKILYTIILLVASLSVCAEQCQRPSEAGLDFAKELQSKMHEKIKPHLSAARTLKNELNPATECPVKSCQDAMPKDLPEETIFKSDFYIFVSTGLGETALFNLAQEANRFGGVLVLRGLRNNSMKETLLILKKVIDKTKANFMIDPTLFSEYQIHRVPSMVLTEGAVFDKLSGRVSLAFALEKMGALGDLSEQALVRLQSGGVSE